MIAVPAPSAALTRLRSSMRAHHDRVESSLDLMSPHVDRARYRQFLERTYGFVAACERALDIDRAPIALAIHRRLKTDALVADLKSIGHSETSIRRLPFPDVLPAVSSWPSALGYFYVMEGSTLGGQVLSRHFRTSLHLADDNMTFLAAYRAETGVMWKQMLDVLEDGLAEATSEAAITRTAGDTFDVLTHWHARPLRHE
jgi:heme oxygenase